LELDLVMDQVIDIETDGRHISRDRGFLLVSEGGNEVGRVPLDQIAAVIVHAHGITYSNAILVALAEQGSPVVLCAANHQPRAALLPLAGHHTQGARMRAQWQAKSPMLKQAWKRVVIRKIEFQAAALAAVGENPEPLKFIARGVRSGDTGNAEAQAARRYWPKMMGSAFRRDTDGA
jgi:CRISP-associated protein Cas1